MKVIDSAPFGLFDIARVTLPCTRAVYYFF